MDLEKSKEKKFKSVKKLLRSLSIIPKKYSTLPAEEEEAAAAAGFLAKSKSCSHAAAVEKEKHVVGLVAPGGCFSVYVGPEKQRFVIKMRFLSHPLFKMLLEDAELEYGFCNEGPILLPCDVDLFYKVLAEMDCGSHEKIQSRNNIGFGCGNCSPFNPTWRWGNSDMAVGYGSYTHLTPSSLLKMNHS